MNKILEFEQCAENCSELAANAKDERARRRYERMEKAWKDLAKTQAWLDRKVWLDGKAWPDGERGAQT